MSEDGGVDFNMSLQSLKRIDAPLWKIGEAALTGDLEGWDIAIKQLRRESAAYLKPKTFEEISKDMAKLNALNWIKIDDYGRRIIVEDKAKEVEEALDEITIKFQNGLFAAGILMKKAANKGTAVVTT